MSLHRTTDIAAKQILDSTRVYKEYVRVRDESDRLKGSLFWKKVGPYEYLAQKLHGKVTYGGTRTSDTEREYGDFKQKKAQLRQRARKLKDSVLSCQRLNKAVRAGTVPSAVMDALHLLEKSGLSEGSVVLGTPALFAYGLPAGVNLEKVSAPAQASVVEDAKHYLHVLVHASQSAVTTALPELRSVADVRVETSPKGGSSERKFHVLEFKFGRKHEDSTYSAKDAHWSTVATQMAAEVQWAGKFEQVVIGKTGTMAIMRTLDPRFFAMISHAAVDAHPKTMQDPVLVQRQAEVVDSLITDHLVVSQLQESECRRRVSDIAQRVFTRA